MQKDHRGISVLESNTMRYWSLSRGFRISDAPTVAVQRAFTMLNDMQAHTPPNKKLLSRITQLREAIIVGNVSPKVVAVSRDAIESLA